VEVRFVSVGRFCPDCGETRAGYRWAEPRQLFRVGCPRTVSLVVNGRDSHDTDETRRGGERIYPNSYPVFAV